MRYLSQFPCSSTPLCMKCSKLRCCSASAAAARKASAGLLDRKCGRCHAHTRHAVAEQGCHVPQLVVVVVQPNLEMPLPRQPTCIVHIQHQRARPLQLLTLAGQQAAAGGRLIHRCLRSAWGGERAGSRRLGLAASSGQRTAECAAPLQLAGALTAGCGWKGTCNPGTSSQAVIHAPPNGPGPTLAFSRAAWCSSAHNSAAVSQLLRCGCCCCARCCRDASASLSALWLLRASAAWRAPAALSPACCHPALPLRPSKKLPSPADAPVEDR